MDFVHIWYDDRYRSKVLFRLKVKVKNRNFILNCFKSSYFPKYAKDLLHIWNDNRYRSKVIFVITPTNASDLKVKITDLEISYLIPDNVIVMTINDQTKAQEILSRAKMP